MMQEEKGFTLTEVLVATVLIATVLTLFYSTLFETYRQSFLGMASAQMAVDSSNVLLRMSEEVRIGAEIRNTNSIADSNAPSGGWQTGPNTGQIVVARPATDQNNEFIIDPNTGNPYMNEVVFFGDGESIYKRVLANPNASGNTETTTCPEESASASCPRDAVFTINLEDIQFTFYDQDDQLISGSDYSPARSVESEINTERIIFGKTVSFNNQMRMTLRNVAP